MKLALIARIRRKDMSRDGTEASHLDCLGERDCGICARPSLASPASCATGELNVEPPLRVEAQSRALT
jgi:hypothetical protein